MEMGASWETDTPPMLEISCPEYFCTSIGRIEPAGGNCLRIYMCVRRGSVLEPMYSVVMPIEELAGCARLALFAAADHHNEMMMMRPSEH
jgi:hypothetical protein